MWYSIVPDLPTWPWMSLVPTWRVTYLLPHFLGLCQIWRSDPSCRTPACPQRQPQTHSTEEMWLLKVAVRDAIPSFVPNDVPLFHFPYSYPIHSIYKDEKGTNINEMKCLYPAPKLLQLLIHLPKILFTWLHFPGYMGFGSGVIQTGIKD